MNNENAMSIDDNNKGESEVLSYVSILLHDVHGPLLNARSLHEEMKDAIVLMQILLHTNGAPVSAADTAKLNSLMSEDLVPCLEYATKSIEQLSERVTAFERDLDR